MNYPIANPTPQEAEIIERQKTQRNAYIDAMVAYLRQFDTRFGYNAKPTRANVNAIVAGDEIAYHWGNDAPEGLPNAPDRRSAGTAPSAARRRTSVRSSTSTAAGRRPGRSRSYRIQNSE
ncbi:MAG: hypothetical protein R2712_05695 [Vicinamibacterales bacterium]